MQLVFTLVIIIMIWLLSIDILIWDVKYYGRFLPKFGISENGTVCSLFPRFPCVLVRSPNQKRFFSVFKVCSTSLVHLIARQKSLLFGLFSFGQSFIHHSSSLFLLFDRIMGLPFALQAECPRSTSSIPTSVRAIKVADGSRFVWLLTGQRPYIFHRWLVLFFIFISWPSEPRLICRTAQGGVLLRERHSGSNTNHLSSISNGQSCIYLSSYLLCCSIESCDFRFASQTAILVSRRRSQPQYGWSSVPMACGLFGFSGKNVPIIIWLWRKTDLVSQPSSSWVPKNQRMLHRILLFPVMIFTDFLSELFSFHVRSDADAWSQSTEPVKWQCRFRSTATPQKAWRERLGLRPKKSNKRKKGLFQCWKLYSFLSTLNQLSVFYFFCFFSLKVIHWFSPQTHHCQPECWL